MRKGWLTYLVVVAVLGVNIGGAAVVVARDRAVRQQLRDVTDSVSQQLSALSGAMTVFEADLLALKEQQAALTAVTVRESTITTNHTAVAPVVAPTVAAPETKSTAGLVKLNSATIDQLMELPGIGAAFAERIVAARPFTSVEQLDQVKGIGEKTLAKLTPLVTVE